MATLSGFRVLQLALLVLWSGGAHSQQQPSIALLLDGVDDVTFQTTALTGDKTVTVHDITGFTPFQLYNKVCTLANSGTVVMVTQASCHALTTLSSAANKLGVTLIAEGHSCQESEAEEQPMDASNGREVISVKTREPPHVDVALMHTLVALGWQDLLVIQENKDTYTYAESLRNMDSVLDGVDLRVQRFEVGSRPISAEIQDILTYIGQTGEHRHVLVACGVTCIKELFRMAIELDATGNQQELFSVAMNWLVLADEDDMDEILSSVQTLNHVTLITPPSKAAESRMLLDNLLQIANHSQEFLSEVEEWQWETQTTICGTKIGYIHLNLTNEIQLNITDDIIPDTTPIMLYAALWKPGRVRSFEAVAEWTEHEMLLFDDIFPNIKRGLNGKHLVVGTLPWEPFVIANANSTTGYSGFCMDLLRMVASQLNFTYELREPADGAWGAYMDGKWTGLVGEVASKVTDMVAAPLNIDMNRSRHVDFSEPFFIELQSVIVQYPDPKLKNWRIYLDPFQWDVWTCVVCSIPLIGIILWAFRRLSEEYNQQEKRKFMGQLDQSLWYSFGSFLTQGSDILPSAQSGRFVVGFWLMYCLVVIASYSGNLVAFFTVSNPTVPFKTLEEMVNSTHKFGTLGGTFTYMYIMLAQNGIFKKVADRIRYFNETDPSVLSFNHASHLAKVRAEDYAYIADVTAIQMVTTVNCNLDKIDDDFIPLQYGLTFQNNSAYTAMFNEALDMFVENGLSKRWRQDWWPSMSQCDRGLVTSSKPVSLSDMQGAFFLMAIILAAAMISLFIELGIWRGRRAPPQDGDTVENQQNGKQNQVRNDQYKPDYNTYEYAKTSAE